MQHTQTCTNMDSVTRCERETSGVAQTVTLGPNWLNHGMIPKTYDQIVWVPKLWYPKNCAPQEMGALVAPRQSCKGSQSQQGCASQRQGAGGVWEKQGIDSFGGLWFVHSGKLT